MKVVRNQDFGVVFYPQHDCFSHVYFRFRIYNKADFANLLTQSEFPNQGSVEQQGLSIGFFDDFPENQ